MQLEDFWTCRVKNAELDNSFLLYLCVRNYINYCTYDKLKVTYFKGSSDQWLQ